MIEQEISKIAFKLNCELVHEINLMNVNNLETKFGIKPAVLGEIKEELFSYFKTAAFPKLKILESKFSIFKYDTTEGFGIEAKLFTNNDIETQLTLHTAFYHDQLKYRLIEVM